MLLNLIKLKRLATHFYNRIVKPIQGNGHDVKEDRNSRLFKIEIMKNQLAGNESRASQCVCVCALTTPPHVHVYILERSQHKVPEEALKVSNASTDYQSICEGLAYLIRVKTCVLTKLTYSLLNLVTFPCNMFF